MKKALLMTLLLMTNYTLAEEPSKQDSFFPQKMTAKDLMFACASSYLTNKGRERRKYCTGFISGVEESIRLLSLPIQPEICLPKGKTASQYADSYILYASRKTTDLNKPAALIVIEAFQDAFPCPENQ